MGYDFEIDYKPGKENLVSDALSIVQRDKELRVFLSTRVLETPTLKQEIEGDISLQK